MMKKIIYSLVVTSLFIGIAGLASASVITDAVSLQLHNPNDDSTLAKTKSQFVMRNDSDAGVNITSILWTPKSPIFFDTTSIAPGFGLYRDYEVSPAQTYSAGFDITVLGASNTIVGYTGPANISNGATSILLTFSDFNPGEAFGFWSDLDYSNSDGIVTNAKWNGSTTKIVFSNGGEIDYTWQTPDNDGRSFGAEKLKTEISSTPEPATMSLLGLGLFGFLRFKRKSK